MFRIVLFFASKHRINISEKDEEIKKDHFPTENLCNWRLGECRLLLSCLSENLLGMLGSGTQSCQYFTVLLRSGRCKQQHTCLVLNYIYASAQAQLPVGPDHAQDDYKGRGRLPSPKEPGVSGRDDDSVLERVGKLLRKVAREYLLR